MYKLDDEKNPKWLKWVPIIALIVSLIALTFQTTVLYPWHLELSREFKKLARSI